MAVVFANAAHFDYFTLAAPVAYVLCMAVLVGFLRSCMVVAQEVKEEAEAELEELGDDDDDEDEEDGAP